MSSFVRGIILEWEEAQREDDQKYPGLRDDAVVEELR
jgi:hypothetical protein